MELTKEQIRILNRYKRSPSFFQSRNLDKIVQKLQATGLSESEALSSIFYRFSDDFKLRYFDMFLSKISKEDNYEVLSFLLSLSIQQQEQLLKNINDSKISEIIGNLPSELQEKYFERYIKSDYALENIEQLIISSYDDEGYHSKASEMLRPEIIRLHREEILNRFGNNEKILSKMWDGLSSELKSKYYGLYLQSSEPDEEEKKRLYKFLDSKLQYQLLVHDIEKIIELGVRDSNSSLKLQELQNELHNTKDEVYEEYFQNLFEIIKQKADIADENDLKYILLDSLIVICPDKIKEKHSSTIEKHFLSDHVYYLDVRNEDKLCNIISCLNENSRRILMENHGRESPLLLEECYKKIDIEKQREIYFNWIEDGRFKDLLNKLYNLMNFEDIEDAKLCLSKYLEKYNPEKKDIVISRLEKLYEKNNNVLSTINFDFIESDVIDLLPEKFLENITQNFYSQEKMHEHEGVLKQTNIKIISRLERLYEKNNNVLSTINFDFIELDIMNLLLTKEQMLRITDNSSIQEVLLEYKTNEPFIMAIANMLTTDENWTLPADYIFKNVNQGNYDKLLLDIKKMKSQSLSKEQEDNFVIVLSKPNYFGITNMEDVEKYFDSDGKRNKMLLSIMKGEDVELPSDLKHLNQEELKKFAISEYLYYGMDLVRLEKVKNDILYELQFFPKEYSSDEVMNLKQLITEITSLNDASIEELDKIVVDIIEGRKQPTEYVKDIYLENYVSRNGFHDLEQYSELYLDRLQLCYPKEFLDNLGIVLSNPNYFGITSIEDVKKYFDADGKRNQMLLSIMRGEDVELPNNLKHLNQEELKKFAVLEYLYGIDLEKSNKYEIWFQGISELKLEGNKFEYIKQLITEITSLNNASIEELDKIISDITEGRMQPTEYIKDIHLESKTVNLFGEAFERGIYNPQKSENDKIQSIEYNGSSIDVYRIHDDFKMFARVEGAYSYLPPIPDYRKFYDSPNITAHGNCESIIGQDQIGLARNLDGNIVPGYALVPKNSILLSAPYDLVSSSSNKTIAPLHEGLSLEFYNLQEMIDNTRHTHNETVMERVLVDEHGNVQKLKPNYLIWIEDRKTDKFPPEFTESSKKSQVHLWEETQRAAHELGIPIVIINREECAERENEKIEHLKKILRGEEELPEGKDLADIAREAIIKFENNVVGLQFAEDDVRFKYFTPTQREDLMKVVMDVLERMPETAYEERVEYLTKIADGIKQESTKFSVGSKTVDLSLIEYYDSKAKEISEKLVEYEKYIGKGSMINFDISEEIKTMFETDIRAIANTDYYKDNKAHSIEHIEKVMLFSLILAQNEELDESDTKILLASAAFHDSFRAGNDGNGPHAAGSAIRAKEYFEGNENNSYGINKNDIPLIQVAIAYHEYEEKIPGKVDREQIGKLCEEYGYTGDFEKVVQISSILKDADALDRERFAARGKLNPDLLRTDSAKSDEMILLAQKVNGMYAKKMIERNYKIDEKIDIFNAVRILRDQRYKNRNMITETTLSVDEMLQLFDEIVNEHTSDVDKKRTKRSGLEGCMDDGKLRSGQAEKAIEAVNIAIRSKTSEISIQDEIDEDEQAE